MSAGGATTQPREPPAHTSSLPSGPLLLEGIEFLPAGGPSWAVRRPAGHPFNWSIGMNKNVRIAALVAAAVLIVGVVVYIATRGGTPPREQGLVGPKGPPPAKTAAPR